MSARVRLSEQPDEVLAAVYDVLVDVGSSGSPVPTGVRDEAQRIAMIVQTEQSRRAGRSSSPTFEAWLAAVNEARPPEKHREFVGAAAAVTT
jgi:hypothetical protein